MKNSPPAPIPEVPHLKVAAYVRMSTEHQRYSTANQMDVIREYAERRGMEIVRVYSDEGKSGLRIKGRDALSRMLSDVGSGKAVFSSILVYDISRWGRFQDADESAHYEFLCRRQGIAVHYCAEQFENDGSMMANMNKMMKRMMAGDYSRELSAKVFQGACRLIRMGFKQGGTAGYGLRRLLVDHQGQTKAILRMGEQKSIQMDRVTLIPGPDNEVADVKWMYRAFVHDELNEAEIARILNARGSLTDFSRPWTRGTVHQVLTNEKYIGNNIYHRTSFKLKSKHVKNDPGQWVRADAAWPSVIEPEIFHAAQAIIIERSKKLSNDEMLEKLRGLFGKHGRISGILIDEDESMPSSTAFRHRFGSLVAAYSLVGYTPATDYRFIEDNKAIREMRPELFGDVMRQLVEIGATAERQPDTDLVLVNGELLVSIVLCRHFTTERGSSRWLIRFDNGLRPDLTVAARMHRENRSIRDYYIIPMIDMGLENLAHRVADENRIEIDAYRFDDLSCFFRMAERTRIKDLA